MPEESILIGTCGWSYWDAPDGWRDTYESKLAAFAADYDLVEVNRTFYGLPQVETARRWRRQAGPDFTFTLKAWQALTHPTSSPTWGDTDGLTDAQREGFGYLRPNDAVRSAWAETRAVAQALDADVCLIQTPPSFGPTDEHEANMRELLSSIDRGDLTLAWEPRGDWHAEPDRIAAVCADLDLVHAADVLRRDPVSTGPTAYARLHGLNDDPYDYAYTYDEAELDRLARTLSALAASHEHVYCLFNNYGQYENATQLAGRL